MLYEPDPDAGLDSRGLPFPDRHNPDAVCMYVMETYRQNDLCNHLSPVEFFYELYRVIGVGGNFPYRSDVNLRVAGADVFLSFDHIEQYCLSAAPAGANPLANERAALLRIRRNWRERSLYDSVKAKALRLMGEFYYGRLLPINRRLPASRSHRAPLTHFRRERAENRRRAETVRLCLRTKNYRWLYDHLSLDARARLPVDPQIFAKLDDRADRPHDWGEHELVGHMDHGNAHHAVIATLRDSKEDKLQVAFCETWEKFAAGRYTRMKPGRFLAKYGAPGYSEAQRKAIAEEFVMRRTPPTVHFIGSDDPDGWEAVYECGHGFSSCMMYDHPSNRYIDEPLHGMNHPVRSYACGGSNLRLAYIANREWDGDMDGFKVYARSLVNDTEKAYIRNYGDERLVTALRELGYGHRRSGLFGEPLAKRKHPTRERCLITPYLDAGAVIDGGDHLLIVDAEEGGLGCGAEGWVSQDELENATRRYNNGEGSGGYECACCGGDFDEDDLSYVESYDGSVCEGCLDHNFVQAYGRRGRRVLMHADSTTYCEDNGRSYVTDELEYIDDVVLDSEGQLRHIDYVGWVDYANEYYDLDRLVQTEDGENLLREDAVELANGSWVLADDAVEIVVDGREEVHLKSELVCVQLKTTNHWLTADQFVTQAHRYSVEEYFDKDEDRVRLRLVTASMLLPRLDVYLSTHRGRPGTYGYEPATTEGEFSNIFVGDDLHWGNLVDDILEANELQEAA